MSALAPQDRGPGTPCDVPNDTPLFSRLLRFSARKKKQRTGDQVVGRQQLDDVSSACHRVDRLDRMNASLNDGDSCSEAAFSRGQENMSSSSIGDGDSVYGVCETVDDSLCGLHTCIDSRERVKIRLLKDISFEHDWVLDGTDSEGDDESEYPKTRQRRKFGDAALDQMLGMLEIENASYTTSCSSCNSSLAGDNNSAPGSKVVNEAENRVDEDEEVIEFADFSHFDAEKGDCGYAEYDEGRKASVSVEDVFARERNLQNDVLYEYEGNEPGDSNLLSTPLQEVSNPADEEEASEEDIRHLATQQILSSPAYDPPSSIQCLVSDLDAELDVTIQTCLEATPAKSVSGSECSSSDHDGCANLMSTLEEERNVDRLAAPRKAQKEHKQSLLMSSILLESLPVPLPSALSDDPLASLTRRIQKDHLVSKAEKDYANRIDATLFEEEILEAKLADTIHMGYYSSAGQNCDSDHFDSIVNEEIQSVPWPFHIIDLKESLLGDDDCTHSEEDSDESIDHLNFDSYISNRLGELDLAIGEVMSCMLSRVSQKEDAINRGVEDIYAAELDISTALMIAESSREFLHHAKNGYELDDHRMGQHNVASGALDIVRYADSKDRLHYLLQTVDRISSICDQEAQWWRDARAKMSHPDGYQKLVDETRRLRDLVRGEEILNHVASLQTMRERLNNLPEALQSRIEGSLADLFARILLSDEQCPAAFDEYFVEYETLLHSWLSCYQMKIGDTQHPEPSQQNIMAAEWSGCILNILCFEASRAFACSMVENAEPDDDVNDDTLGGIKSQLNEMKFEATQKGDLESLCDKLLVMRLGGGHHSSALSATFFHLCSRLVELMNLYSMALQWHMDITDRLTVEHGPCAEDATGECEDESGETEPNHHTEVSSLSSEDKESSSSTDEASIDEAASARPVPEHLEIRTDVTSSFDKHKAIYTSMEVIRRSLWKTCEASLTNLVEFYTSQGGDLAVQSGDSTDFATGKLRLMYDALLQFVHFSSSFLSDGDGEEECSALKNELSKLHERHLRSVFVEAMKTLGTLLRHEPWQLAPLELSGAAFKVEAGGSKCKGCGVSGQSCAQCTAMTTRAVYEAVGELLLGSTNANQKPDGKHSITERSEIRGYQCCRSVAQTLDGEPDNHSPQPKGDSSQRLLGCFGMSSDDFMAKIQQFVEMKPCGERAMSILTQSSANGLARWTARLLAIGNALPLVADDASAAVMKLFDLYFLTVFRFCAGNKANEDVLIGLGRGTTARSASSATVSVTMEADAVAPLPRDAKGFSKSQQFVRSSRRRLETMVNLDKFSSSDEEICPTSDAVVIHGKRLEKEAAAACSCLFAAILVDVASKIFSDGQCHNANKQPLWDDLRDIATSIEKDEGIEDSGSQTLEDYAISAVSIMPILVTQSTRFATAKSISGKETIFQIICCGRAWEECDMQEHPNAYVDDLCERLACLWGYMSSSMRLPPPVLQFTWDQLVRSSFMLILEGFSKVTKCSTEGRSLMSMDLATLSHGLIPESVQEEVEDDYPMISPPPQACREEMMRYVDTFIKVFYFPIEDTITWIRENSGDYHFDHSLSLVTSKAAGTKDKQLVASWKQEVTNIYNRMR